jgi:hypothetical protein
MEWNGFGVGLVGVGVGVGGWLRFMTWRTKTVWGGACQKEKRKKKKTGSRFFWVLAREDKTRCDCEDAPVVLRGQGACLRRGVGGGDRFTRFDRFVRALYIARAHTQREKRERNCMLADQGLRLDKVRPCSRGLPSQQEKQKSLLFLV